MVSVKGCVKKQWGVIFTLNILINKINLTLFHTRELSLQTSGNILLTFSDFSLEAWEVDFSRGKQRNSYLCLRVEIILGLAYWVFILQEQECIKCATRRRWWVKIFLGFLLGEFDPTLVLHQEKVSINLWTVPTNVDMCPAGVMGKN